jgi:hypothetical protein
VPEGSVTDPPDPLSPEGGVPGGSVTDPPDPFKPLPLPTGGVLGLGLMAGLDAAGESDVLTRFKEGGGEMVPCKTVAVGEEGNLVCLNVQMR